MRKSGADSSALNISFGLSFKRTDADVERTASSTSVMALIANGSQRPVTSLRILVCSRESRFGSPTQRIRMCVSNKNLGCKLHLPSLSLTTSQRSEVSRFTISPTISILPAKRPLSDFHRFFFTGWRTATGRPRFVTVIVSLRSSTSSKNARHFALNSVAVTVRFAISRSYHSSGHLTGGQPTSIKRTSMTFVLVGPVISRSPSGWKKL
jgi:hypothetical protein